MRPHQLSTGAGLGTVLRFERNLAPPPTPPPAAALDIVPALNAKALALVAVALRIVAHAALAGLPLARNAVPGIGPTAARLLLTPLGASLPAYMPQPGLLTALILAGGSMALIHHLTAGASARVQRLALALYALSPVAIVGCALATPEMLLTPLALAVLCTGQAMLGRLRPALRHPARNWFNAFS